MDENEHILSGTPSSAGEGSVYSGDLHPDPDPDHPSNSSLTVKDSKQLVVGVDGASPEEEGEKVTRSGSMFVRISNTSVDRERMEAFDKAENLSDDPSTTELVIKEDIGTATSELKDDGTSTAALPTVKEEQLVKPVPVVVNNVSQKMPATPQKSRIGGGVVAPGPNRRGAQPSAKPGFKGNGIPRPNTRPQQPKITTTAAHQRHLMSVE